MQPSCYAPQLQPVSALPHCRECPCACGTHRCTPPHTLGFAHPSVHACDTLWFIRDKPTWRALVHATKAVKYVNSCAHTCIKRECKGQPSGILIYICSRNPGRTACILLKALLSCDLLSSVHGAGQPRRCLQKGIVGACSINLCVAHDSTSDAALHSHAFQGC